MKDAGQDSGPVAGDRHHRDPEVARPRGYFARDKA